VKIFIRIVLIFVVLLILTASYTVPSQLEKESNIYRIDTDKSFVHWKCFRHNGIVKFNQGNIAYSENVFHDIDLSLDMTSIMDKDIEESELLRETLNNVLKSVEFFRVNEFPNASFKLHSYTNTAPGKFQITGDIRIFKSDLCTTFNAEVKEERDSLFFKTDEIILDRTHWGIYYLSAKNKNPKDEEEGFVIPDSITIKVNLRAYQK